MELQTYLRILLKRGWIIVIAAAIAGAAAFGFSKLQSPLYRANLLVSVVPARADWGLSNSTKDLLRNYQTNLLTHRMAQRVIDQAQLDMNSYELLAEVEVNPEPDRFVIDMVAKDNDPQTAIEIVQTMAQIFVDERTAWNQQQDKRDRIDVSVVDDARDAPLWRPQPLVNLVAGAILGAIFGILVVFLLEWLEAGVIRTPKDIERHLDMGVLGAIPAAHGSKPVVGARPEAAARPVPQT